MKIHFPFLNNLSVTWKFILSYFAILIVPVISVGFYLSTQISNSAISQAQLVMEQSLIQTREDILQKVKVIESTSEIIVLNTRLLSFLDDKYEGRTDQIEDYNLYMVPFISNIFVQNKLTYTIRTFMTNNSIPESWDNFYRIDRVRTKNPYKQVISDTKQLQWIQAHPSITINPHTLSQPQKHEKVFSLYRRIHSIRNGAFLGILEIEVKEDVLLSSLKNNLANQLGRVFMVDMNGRIISETSSQDQNEKMDDKLVQNIIKKERSNFIANIGRKRSIVVSGTIDELSCKIIGVYPTYHFTQKVRSSSQIILGVLLGSSIVLGFAIYFITNVLLVRLKNLVKAMKKVKDDNLNVAVPVTSEDEFGELALNFNRMTERIHDLVETVYKIQLMEKEAEIKALEAHINPHFLYNTLATITWSARKNGNIEIEEITNALAKFYRLVLNKGDTLTSVREEVEQLQAYLVIQKIRFEEMFDVVYTIDESILGYKVLKNILQPLVENALNHGIEPKRAHGTILVKVERVDECISFQVIDDGVGMDKRKLANVTEGMVERSPGSGYAVKNVNERLKVYYGKEHCIRIYSAPGIGTTVKFSIPIS